MNKLWLAAILVLGCGDGANDGGTPPLEGWDIALPESVSQDALLQSVTALASEACAGRDEGTSGNALAREFIIDRLTTCGVMPAGDDGFEQFIDGGDGINVLGVITGTKSSERHVLLSAHYDHLGEIGGDIYYGANDNAAGVATVLGIACALAQRPPERSVLVALWDAEEPPTFLEANMGSQHFVDSPTVPLSSIDVAIVLDLVGGDLWDGFDGHVMLGAELSSAVADAVSRAPVPSGLLALRAGLHLVEHTSYGLQPWSDYHAFRQEEVPVLFLSNGQNKRYHTPDDRVEFLNLPKMAKQAELLLSVTWNLANASATPTFSASGKDYETDAMTALSVLDAALADDGIVDTLDLSNTTRHTLENDRDAVLAVLGRLAEGDALRSTDIAKLRDATQRIMCLAGSTYSEALCQYI